MKVNRLEAHDRLLQFKKEQDVNIFKGAEDCMKSNPLSLAIQERSHYLYLFAHPRTHDDGVTKVMYWQPRLSKPEAQTNSYLFRALSKTDTIEVCWLIPPESMWPQYKKKNVTESEIVLWSILQYCNNKQKLEQPHPDDMPEAAQKVIFTAIYREHDERKRVKPVISEASQGF
jgi:hypothetical protein